MNTLPLLRLFPEGDKPGVPVILLLLVLALFISLAIHELGHLITGLVQGFRFELFVVGLLGIRRTDEGIRVYLNKDLGMMGGVAATLPVMQDPRNKRKFARVVLAGPITSLVFAILSFLFLGLSSSGAARGFWLPTGACSLAIFIATVVPGKTGFFFTDRVRFQRLISKGKAGNSELALLTIITQHVMDKSCRNISPENIAILRADDDSVIRFWGDYYEFHYFKDNAMNEEAALAKQKIIASKDRIPPQLWKLLNLENL